MNVIVPRGIYFESQAITFMSVGSCLISGQGNKAIGGLIQDSLLGMYILTMQVPVEEKDKDGNTIFVGGRPSVRMVDRFPEIRRDRWMQLVATIERESMVNSLRYRCAKAGINMFSGKGLVSILFPEGFFYQGKVKRGKAGEDIAEVLIEDGILIRGALDNAILGASANSVEMILSLNYDPGVAISFMHAAATLGAEFLSQVGHTLGYESISLCQKTAEALEEEKERLRKELKEHTVAKRHVTNVFDRQMLEAGLLNTANNAPLEVGNLLKRDLPVTNPSRLMAESGSKGNYTSLAQGMGVIGQITIQRNRLRPELEAGRIYTSQLEGDDDPIYGGFCDTSYAEGKPPEIELNQIFAVRLATISIALKTGETGYLERRLRMFCMGLKTHTDGSVRLPDGRIVQFMYGGDGLDPQRLVKHGNRARFIDIRNVIESIKFDIAAGNQLNLVPKVYVNMFEKSKLLSLRAQQIEAGAYSKYAAESGSPTLAAEQEWREGDFPVVTVNRWNVDGEEESIKVRIVDHSFGEAV